MNYCDFCLCSHFGNPSYAQFNPAIHPRKWFNYKNFWDKLEHVSSGNSVYYENAYDTHYKHSHQGPVVQSVVSLTSSLRVISLTVLANSMYNILIFFAEKMWVAFALQKLLTFFQQKNSAYLRITRCKF